LNNKFRFWVLMAFDCTSDLIKFVFFELSIDLFQSKPKNIITSHLKLEKEQKIRMRTARRKKGKPTPVRPIPSVFQKEIFYINFVHRRLKFSWNVSKVPHSNVWQPEELCFCIYVYTTGISINVGRKIFTDDNKKPIDKVHSFLCVHYYSLLVKSNSYVRYQMIEFFFQHLLIFLSYISIG
jgi:hypothetical protein